MSKTVLLAMLSATLLGACGGGEDNTSTATPQTVSVPLETAVINQVDNGISANFTVAGTVDNTATTGSGTLTDAPPVATALNGTTVLETTDTVTDTLTENGVASPPQTETTQILTNPQTGAEVSETRSDGSVVDFPPYTIPTSVMPGDSATLTTGTKYSDQSRTDKVGTVDISYSAESESPETVKVHFDKKDKDNNNVQQRDEERTFSIDRDGNSKFESRQVKGSDQGHQDNLDEEED
ncbi:MAG: hypothetical protein JO067_02920 [Cupriavidus sp.]|nr:hypothetical protein [Cupriavidus sp.]